ncbi:MAG: hypothetical protein KFF73_09450, partial [Cyclobacteriaceae bacterium]|nr:hypothetical protein [Cyclobacteriaceae bacterium]
PKSISHLKSGYFYNLFPRIVHRSDSPQVFSNLRKIQNDLEDEISELKPGISTKWMFLPVVRKAAVI